MRKFLFLTILILTSSITFAQKIQKKGTLDLKEIEVTEELNGNAIVPPLDEDQGIIILKVRGNQVFAAEDVRLWFMDNLMSIQGLRYDPSDIVMNEVGDIRIKYTFRFLTGTEQISRKVQIRHSDFNTYFSSHRFYKQKVVTYQLQASELPIYDQEEIPVGTLLVKVSEPETEIVLINEETEEEVARKVILGSQSFFDVPIGTYSLIATKTGFETFKTTSLVVRKDAETNSFVSLEQQQSTDLTKQVQFISEFKGLNITLSDDYGTKIKTKLDNLSDSMYVGKSLVRTGDYTMKVSGASYQNFSTKIKITEDAQFKVGLKTLRPGIVILPAMLGSIQAFMGAQSSGKLYKGFSSGNGEGVFFLLGSVGTGFGQILNQDYGLGVAIMAGSFIAALPSSAEDEDGFRSTDMGRHRIVPVIWAVSVIQAFSKAKKRHNNSSLEIIQNGTSLGVSYSF